MYIYKRFVFILKVYPSIKAQSILRQGHQCQCNSENSKMDFSSPPSQLRRVR